MPLVKSANPKAVGENIKTEVAAGKPKKQALAIALNIQRESATGARKTALEQAYDKYVEEK
jgi:cell division FtsZ-interacting protein ZapD